MSGMTVLGGPPIGSIIDFSAASTPPGVWLACNGQNVSRATYAGLFSAIGTTWGAGDGATTFTLPDLRRKTTVGEGGTATAALAATVGAIGGAESHTLAETEIAPHVHTGTANSAGAHTHGYGASGDLAGNFAGSGPGLSNNTTTSAGAHTHTLTVNSTGGGGAHNNLQPSAVVRKLIKAA